MKVRKMIGRLKAYISDVGDFEKRKFARTNLKNVNTHYGLTMSMKEFLSKKEYYHRRSMEMWEQKKRDG